MRNLSSFAPFLVVVLLVQLLLAFAPISVHLAPTEKSANPPAPQKQQPSAPAQRQSNDEVCAICLGPLNVGSTEVVPCRHKFHSNCIQCWRQQKVSTDSFLCRVPCPMCRADIGVAPAPKPAAPGAPIKVIIRTSKGNWYTQQFSPEHKVFEVKKFILARDAIPIANQQISMDGRSLDDHRTLGSYGLNNRSFLQPHLRQYDRTNEVCTIM